MRKVLSEYTEIKNGRNRRMLVVECHCGQVDKIRKDQLAKSTQCKSCRSKDVGTKHGMANTRQYNIWKNMKQRCGKVDGYKDVSYDPSWKTFGGFWADMEDGYSGNLTLDRIDPFGNYEKGNCRWANLSTQNGNIRGYGESHFPNVYRNRDRWMARKMVDSKYVHAGTFNTQEEAHEALLVLL